MFSGTAVAQAIPLLGSLIIARLFLPADFGIFAAWLGVAALSGVIITLRFEMALALEPDGEPRRLMVVATLATTIGAGLVVGAIAIASLVLWGDRLGALTPLMIALFGPTTLLLALVQIWPAWAAAEGRFRALASMRVVQAAAITGLQIGAGFLAPSAQLLAAAHVAGVLAGVVFAVRVLPVGAIPGNIGELVQRLWSRYRRFPMFALPADAVNTTAAQLPVIIIAARFGADVAGYLALAMRTLGAPISLMGTAVLDVFKRHAATSWRETGSARGDYQQTFLVLGAGAVVAAVIFAVFGEELFAFAFGESWRQAGRIAVWLLPLFALRFVASPLSYMFYIAEKQHLDMIWQIALLTMTLATLFVFQENEPTLKAYAWGYSALYVVYLVMSYRLSLGKPKA